MASKGSPGAAAVVDVQARLVREGAHQTQKREHIPQEQRRHTDMSWNGWSGWRRSFAAGGSGRKYGNRKAEVDGQVFDSRKEARRFYELQLLQEAGTIRDLETQKRFLLIPTQREPDTQGPRGGVKPGKVIERAVEYIADFYYIDNETGEAVVEDTKGIRTKEYIIKRKLMLYVHHIRIREI